MLPYTQLKAAYAYCTVEERIILKELLRDLMCDHLLDGSHVLAVFKQYIFDPTAMDVPQLLIYIEDLLAKQHPHYTAEQIEDISITLAGLRASAQKYKVSTCKYLHRRIAAEERALRQQGWRKTIPVGKSLLPFIQGSKKPRFLA